MQQEKLSCLSGVSQEGGGDTPSKFSGAVNWQHELPTEKRIEVRRMKYRGGQKHKEGVQVGQTMCFLRETILSPEMGIRNDLP